MGANELYALIPIFGVLFGCPTAVLLGTLLFPSTRAALARRLGGGGREEFDDRALTHLASADANVTALRSEVYALRCEVAALSAALPAARQSPPAIPGAGVSAGRETLGARR